MLRGAKSETSEVVSGAHSEPSFTVSQLTSQIFRLSQVFDPSLEIKSLPLPLSRASIGVASSYRGRSDRPMYTVLEVDDFLRPFDINNNSSFDPGNGKEG